MLMLLSLLCSLIQDEPVFSGPQPGEKLVPFVATGVLGKDADQKLDVVTETDTKPCVLIFVHERSRPAFGLSNMVLRLVQHRGPEKIAGSLIFLTDDPTETAEWMNRVPDYFPKQIRLGISVDGKEGPGVYGLNRNVALTVLIAKVQIAGTAMGIPGGSRYKKVASKPLRCSRAGRGIGVSPARECSRVKALAQLEQCLLQRRGGQRFVQQQSARAARLADALWCGVARDDDGGQDLLATTHGKVGAQCRDGLAARGTLTQAVVGKNHFGLLVHRQ